MLSIFLICYLWAMPLPIEYCNQSIEYKLREYPDAHRIAQCESKFNPLAENPNSTAKGIFQFLDGTWEGYCKGDVFNYQDQLRCFNKLYPKYPSWWTCK